MKTHQIPFSLFLLVLVRLFVPIYTQSIQPRHYRPYPDKCDRHGRCSPKEGYIEETVHEEDYKSDKDRPPELTRDDWPTRPRVTETDYDRKVDVDREDLKPVSRPSGSSYGGGYNPKPDVDKDDLKPVRPSGSSYGGVNDPKPETDKDDLNPARPAGSNYGGGHVDRDSEKTGTGRLDGGYNPKSTDGRDDDLKPHRGGRPSTGGSGYGGSYNPKPVNDRDDSIKPVGRPGGYGGGYNPKPVIDRDENYKPEGGRPRGGSGGYVSGYDPKLPADRDGDLKPAGLRPGGGSGYNIKPADDYDLKRDRDDYDTKSEEDKDNVRRPGGGSNRKPGGSRGVYNTKIDEEDYEIKPARGGGGYYPDDYDYKSKREDLGGYSKHKDDYNDDYGINDDGKYDEYDGGSKPISVVDSNCICVPYYQCQDGHIVTDGAGIIDARKRPEPVDELPLDGKLKPSSCGPIHVCCNTPESSTVKPYEHRCGVRNPSGINSRILSPSNKGEADFGEWPWQAAVLKAEGKVNIFQCGGVLIDKYHVLTVAHCVFHLYHYNEYPLKVRLGEWDTQTTTEFLAHEDYRVSKIIIHPEYRNTSLWNDVAVLRLQDPVLFAPHIDTVCLPRYDEVFAGQNCVVTGWGKDAYQGGTFSNVMKEVALQVIDNYKCEEMLRKTRLGRFFQLHEGFLCAGGEYGLDSCKGDGGGPLVCYRKDKSYALAGIVSWGIDCGQPGVPGVYAKIQKYLDWISKTTGVSLQEYWPKQ